LGFLRGKGFRLTMIADPDQGFVNAERKSLDLRLVVMHAGRADGASTTLRAGVLEELGRSFRACSATLWHLPHNEREECGHAG
jgi:hypothetical protein